MKKIVLGKIFNNKQLLVNHNDLQSFYLHLVSSNDIDKNLSLILKKKGLYRIIKSSIFFDRLNDWTVESLPKFYLPFKGDIFGNPKFRRAKLVKSKSKEFSKNKFFVLGPFSKKKRKRKFFSEYIFSKYLKNYEEDHNLFNRFVRILMKKGKLSTYSKSIEKCCQLIWKNHKINPIFFFKHALNNLRPLIELQKPSKGFRNQRLSPNLLSNKKSYKMAIDWIIQGTEQRKERGLGYRLYLELLNACLEKGYGFKKKQELYKACKRNIYSNNN